MTGGFRVDPDRLNDIVEQMARFDQRLESALDDVTAKMQRLYATWAGDAADRQAHAHAEWQRGAADMKAALAVLKQIAATAGTNYTNAASANTTMWQQIR
jgi:WXG100 family type VII secretion target